MQDEIETGCRAEFPCEWICGICAAVCRPRAIDYMPGAVLIGREECVGCGDCARVCPHGILEEEEVAGL